MYVRNERHNIKAMLQFVLWLMVHDEHANPIYYPHIQSKHHLPTGIRRLSQKKKYYICSSVILSDPQYTILPALLELNLALQSIDLMDLHMIGLEEDTPSLENSHSLLPMLHLGKHRFVFY